MKDAITELGEEVRRLWLALFWFHMSVDAICPMCGEKQVSRADTGAERTRLCRQHIEARHSQLLEEESGDDS